jgi:TPR repeat protein
MVVAELSYTSSELPLGPTSLPEYPPAQQLNLPEAIRYCKLAADGGQAEAQFCYAGCLESGEVGKVNIPEAIHYCKLAADGGHAEAQVCYAGYLEREEVGKTNLREAMRYCKLADGGHTEGQFCCA